MNLSWFFEPWGGLLGIKVYRVLPKPDGLVRLRHRPSLVDCLRDIAKCRRCGQEASVEWFDDHSEDTCRYEDRTT